MLHSGPSANIPDQLQGAQDGEYYAYFYTNANTSNSSSLLVSPLIEYSGCTYYLDFWFHRYFPYAYGDVYLQLRGSNDGGLTWDDDPIWYVSGISNENNWQYVHLIIPGNYNKLRFEGITGAYGDIYDLGLDNISISKMEEPFVVTGTYNFSGETSFCDDIIIESGGIFNVKFSSVLHIAPTKKIIVKRGGSLNIESGSTITGVDGNFWKGIELWGNKNAPQTVQYQGLVSINGGATISNATCGIRTIRIDDSDQYNPDYSGGIVHSINGIFLNNKTAVEFFSYNFEESSSYFKKKYSV